MNKEQRDQISTQFLRLVDVMRRLRAPDGCSWDRKQDHQSLKKYILEEAQEVADAVDSGDLLNLREELGDLMMNIVFHAQVAQENGSFTIAEVCQEISDKLISRHPHVFQGENDQISPEQVVELWGELKKEEKVEKSRVSSRMKRTLNSPSILFATNAIQSEAAVVGFDFPNSEEALKKVYEEADEVKEHIGSEQKDLLEEEIGDLMFSIINVARLSGVNPETALKKATEKFLNRFESVEKEAEKDGGFEGKSLEELDVYWEKTKN